MSNDTHFLLRSLRKSDRPEWERLWTAYLEFYETSVAREVYDKTFERLMADDYWEPSGLVVERTGPDGSTSRLAGLVHYLYHAHCWTLERACYLQDLFVDPGCRRSGLGRKLIEGVYAAAEADNVTSVYWMTQDFNSNARALYDQVGRLTPFIKYSHP